MRGYCITQSRTDFELSFLSAEVQAVVAEQAQDFKIDMKKAKQLHDTADNDGNIEHEMIIKIITGMSQDKPKPKSVKISSDTYTRYFSEGVKAKEITETIEKAYRE